MRRPSGGGKRPQIVTSLLNGDHMSSVTLTEAAKLQNNPLIAGVIETIVTVNQVYQVMPFDQIEGNAIEYTRELAMGGVDVIGIGGDATNNNITAQAKTPATFTPVTTSLKVMLGDAYVDHFIQTTMQTPNNQKAVQVASKAKAIARQYQDLFINGNAGTNVKQFSGLTTLIGTSHAQTKNYANALMTLDMIDELISMVKAKDGVVDFIMSHDAAIRKYFNILRSLGGAGIGEVYTLPGGGTVPSYRGIPWFRNDWCAAAGSPNLIGDVWVGCWDDGSRKTGIAGLTSVHQSGVFVSELGEAEGTNDTITRVRFYASLAVYSELGIARGRNIRFTGA